MIAYFHAFGIRQPTPDAPAMTGAVRSGYADLMSPRSARDPSAITVLIHAAGIGSGRPEEGGGPLRGGLTLMNRFTAVIADPEVPHEITMTVGARDGWLACEALMVRAAPDGPPVTSLTLRSVLVSLYMERIRGELGEAGGGGLISRPGARSEHTVSFDLPVAADDWGRLDIAQLRRATRLTPELAATAYREALASADPDQNRRPTAAAADKLGVSRGHVSRLLTEARRQGIEGLGPPRQPRKQPRLPVVAAIVTSRRGVLIGRRNDGKPPWTFIAGEVEPGERPEDAAIREVKEESGVEIRAGHVIGERDHPATGRHMIYMAAKPTHAKRLIVGDEAELAEVKWASLAEAERLLPGMFGPVRDFLAAQLGGRDITDAS